MLKVACECPHCHRSLMDAKHLIREAPSITLLGKLSAEHGGEEGTIRLSSWYGDYQIETSLVIPDGAVVSFSCPFCLKPLAGSRTCGDCSAPMAALQFAQGGSVQFCSRRGCRKHLIEFEDPEADLRAFYQEYLPYME